MSKKGFTLVELLVVIVIIGILAAAAISVFGGGTDKAKVNVIASDAAAMQSAGVLAIADQGWDDNRNITNLAAAGYLSSKPSNPYYNSNDTTNTSKYFYAYGASRVTTGAGQVNPVASASGRVNEATVGGATDYVITKGFQGVNMNSVGSWTGAPASGTATSWN